jgi:hypothetical protein
MRPLALLSATASFFTDQSPDSAQSFRRNRAGCLHTRLVQDRPPGDAKPWVRLYEIIFRRLQVAPIGGRFNPAGIDRDRPHD